jgi:hypothetical protein
MWLPNVAINTMFVCYCCRFVHLYTNTLDTPENDTSDQQRATYILVDVFIAPIRFHENLGYHFKIYNLR